MGYCGKICCALVAGMLAACHGRDAAATADPAEATHLHEGSLVVVPEKSALRQVLAIAPAQKQSVQTPLQAPAVLEADPARVANILPPLSGRISTLYVHLGDAVKAGQPLFTIDSADLAQARSDLRHARIALTQTKKTLERQQDLAEHHIAAQKDLEQAQADYDGAQSEYERAATVFRVIGVDPEAAQAAGSSRELTVRSPLAGRIAMLNLVPGTFANDNAASLMTVSDSDSMALRISTFKSESSGSLSRRMTLVSRTRQ